MSILLSLYISCDNKVVFIHFFSVRNFSSKAILMGSFTFTIVDAIFMHFCRETLRVFYATTFYNVYSSVNPVYYSRISLACKIVQKFEKFHCWYLLNTKAFDSQEETAFVTPIITITTITPPLSPLHDLLWEHMQCTLKCTFKCCESICKRYAKSTNYSNNEIMFEQHRMNIADGRASTNGSLTSTCAFHITFKISHSI